MTPSSLFSRFSTRFAHEAHVIPPMANSIRPSACSRPCPGPVVPLLIAKRLLRVRWGIPAQRAEIRVTDGHATTLLGIPGWGMPTCTHYTPKGYMHGKEEPGKPWCAVGLPAPRPAAPFCAHTREHDRAARRAEEGGAAGRGSAGEREAVRL